MPTHHTLLHNFELMQGIMDTDSSMVEISFLPHYHAMGLICSYLQTLYHGGMGYFMSPVTFIENPGLWMKAFSLFHGTHAKAPNFAFDLVVRKGFPKTIDLSTAHNIVSASEPVCIETIEEFESALAPHGLKKNTTRAGYGLAEHTVYLSGVCSHNDPVIVDGRISCGAPSPGETEMGIYLFWCIIATVSSQDVCGGNVLSKWPHFPLPPPPTHKSFNDINVPLHNNTINSPTKAPIC